MATEHGYDIDGILSVSRDLRVVNGRKALAVAIGRRLTTPRGSLFYDLSYGHDVRQYLNAPSQPRGRVEMQVTTEVLKDERVFDAEVTAFSASDEDLEITVLLTDALGPFSLTVTADKLTVQALLNG
jgi:phage baseplate assembly protein W